MKGDKDAFNFNRRHDSNNNYTRHTSLHNNLFNNGDIKMWIILALNDVDKPYIHSTYESIIDALQMHYKLEDNNIKNQMVEMEIYNDY